MRMSIILAIGVGALTAGGAGVAVGQSGDKPEGRAAPVNQNAKISPPPGSGNVGARHQTSVAALRAHLDHGSYFKGVDWSSARSFPIAGSKLRGWTFNQNQTKRCLAIPDPLAEGYGVTCKTPEEVKAGNGTVLVLAPRGSGVRSVAGAMVAPGDTASLKAPDGASANWERSGDVYAGTAPEGSRLEAAGKRQAVDPPSNELVPADSPSTP